MTPGSFLSYTQLQAIEFLERSVRDLEPLAALTGGAGTGKTVALNALLAREENTSVRVIRVNNFVAGPLSLHRVLASSLGVMDAGDLSAEALEPVLRHALVKVSRSEPPVLAVDDAQSLLPETLRYLCLLAGLREAGRPLIRILLAGRPGFTIRQSMPRQFSLEALAPDDARRLVLHGFEAAGVLAPEQAVQEIMRNGQGNLRKLDALMTAGIETARAEGRRRKTRRGQTRAETGAETGAGIRSEVIKARTSRRSGRGRWLALPVLLVVGAAGLAIAFHGGGVGNHDSKPALTVVPMPPPATAAAQPDRLPVVVPAPVNPPSTAPAKLAAAPPPPNPVVPAPTSATPVPATQAQLHVQAPPLQAAAPEAAPPPIQAAASEASPPAPSPAAPVPVMPPERAQAATRFRVYNISACHQGVCPRWSITDLDQQQHFVAAFNPAGLHLDHDMLQRLRDGSVDLMVSGSIIQNRSGGRTLDAEALQGVAPHHGRVHPPGSGSEPIELAPSQLQSPPPGFLPVPPPSQ